MKFQVIISFGNNSYGYAYFDSESTDQSELATLARAEVRKIYDRNRGLGMFGGPPPARPTIQVREYDTNTHRKKRNGISFKTRWR